MILDWKKHCKQIKKTHLLSRDDPSDNKSIMSQEAHYIKYLTVVEELKPLAKGKDNSAFKEWKKIENGTAAAFNGDPEQQFALFAKIYKFSKNIPPKVFERDYQPIKIYKSEIAFLNSLHVPLWMKQYWMMMLIYWKFASQFVKNVEITTTISNWAMRKANVTDKRYGLYQDKLAQQNRVGDGYVMSTAIYKKKNSRKYWFDWAVEESDEGFIEIKSLDKYEKALKLIVGYKEICPLCGKGFEITGRRQTNLCPSCYAEQRRKYKTSKQFEYRHREKPDEIEKK